MKAFMSISVFTLLIGAVFPLQADTIQTPKSDTAYRTPSDRLENEHRIIMQVVEAAKKEAGVIRQQNAPDLKRVRQMVDFFSGFVDNCHHRKEKRFYFPAAAYQNPGALETVIDRLETEHAYARSIIEELKYALEYNEQNIDFMAERLEAYAALTETHIEKENKQLFPKADVRIAGAEERAILMGFEKIEKIDLGTGFHEKYREMAKELTTSGEDSE